MKNCLAAILWVKQGYFVFCAGGRGADLSQGLLPDVICTVCLFPVSANARLTSCLITCELGGREGGKTLVLFPAAVRAKHVTFQHLTLWLVQVQARAEVSTAIVGALVPSEKHGGTAVSAGDLLHFWGISGVEGYSAVL